ncbi:hypothetical protein AAIR98_001611 [Elusimicrobium simillimum]|uniref:phage head-tail connector protein n=1 Tax=Elusimicrobium simillimum TaxID=3143438 RepID=UPI003C7023E7
MTQVLTTLEETKQYLGITGTEQDALISMLLESVSSAAEVFLGRFIISRIISEEAHFIEDKSKVLQLSFYPVEEVNMIMQNGEEISGEQFSINHNSGILHIKYGFFTGAVLVTYKAGLAENVDAVPADIKLAMWQWVKYLLNKSDGAVKSESLGDYSVSYAELQGAMPVSVLSILEQYRRYSV